MDVSRLSPKEREIYERLRDVKDPEFGQSIIERELIDDVKFRDGVAEVIYHLTVPFCPMPFALFIGRQIRRKAKEVAGVEKVKVIVKDHIQSEVINKILEKEE
jgi:metal-sulfur cluster biosynthetic enzyme